MQQRVVSLDNLRTLAQLLRPYRRFFPRLALFMLLGEMVILGWPYLYKQIVHAIVSEPLAPILYTIGLVTVWRLVDAGIFSSHFLLSHRVLVLIAEIRRDFPVRALKRLLALSQSFHLHNSTGALNRRIGQGTNAICELVDASFQQVIPTFLRSAVTTLILFKASAFVGALFVPVPILFVIITDRMVRRLRPLREQRIRSQEQTSAHLKDAMTNAAMIQACTQEGLIVSQHTALEEKTQTLFLEEKRISRNYSLLRAGLLLIGNLSVVLALVVRVYRRELSAMDFIMYAAFAEQAYNSLFQISHLYDRVAEWLQSVLRLNALFEEVPQIADLAGAVVAPRFRGDIEFRRVCFAYAPQLRTQEPEEDETAEAQPTLEDISFLVPAGQTVALVGHSGAGKSTAFNLIPRFYDPSTGAVRIDGQDLRGFTLKSLREQIAVVPQEPQILNQSIRENLLLGNPEASLEQVVAAAKGADAHGFITALPFGYDTIIGERGLRLSGGQRQRIGIARALLRDPRILLLDEATSNLDSESESTIQNVLQRLHGTLTIVVIAQRLSTIAHADQIVVFEDGRVSEIGDHASLLRQNGIYKRLHQLQVEGVLAGNASPPPAAS